MNRRAVVTLLAALGPAPLAAQGLLYEGGLSVSTGTYIFAPRTTSGVVATGIALGNSRITVRASMPVYFQNTTLISLSGPGGRLPTGGSSSGAVADSGAARKGRGSGGDRVGLMLAAAGVDVPSSAATGYDAAVGDPTMQVTWRAIDAGGTSVSASALAKAPVADTTTFGTGAWDFGIAMGIARWLGRSLVVGLDATYWRLGDMPTLAFRDPVSGSASVTYYGSPTWGAGLSASGSTSAMDGYDGPAWIGAHLVHGSGPRRWGVNAAVGLSETAPDVSVGLTWSVRLTGGG